MSGFDDHRSLVGLLLGISLRRVVSLWLDAGKPVIPLGDGTNCKDLPALINNRSRFYKYYPDIQNWLALMEVRK